MASKPGNYDLSIYKGMTLDLTFTWKDSAGVAVDLTSYTARMQIRNKPGGSDLHETLTNGAGITLGGAAGTIRIQRTAAQTTAYTFARGVYDLELTLAGVVTRLLEGQVIAHEQVTLD